MKALKCIGFRVEEVEIENTLKALQKQVGGYIETVRIRDPRAVMIVNEEGLLLGLPHNPAASLAAGVPIVGVALIVGVDGDEFTDVPDDFSPFA